MPLKNILSRFQIVTAGSLAASVTSTVTNIQYLDNVCIEAIWTGTPTGTFAVQGSLDHQQDQYGNVVTGGNWVTLTGATASASGSGDVALFDLTQLSFPWVRLIYTRVSGSGTLNAYIGGKAV